MIEQAIFFALGCIVTALGALLFAPVFWNRALRITRKRLQLQIPLSMQEIYAERDQLRAEFAVERLRVEQELEGVRAGKVKDMAEIGRRSMDASRLGDALAAAKRDGEGLASDLDGTRRRLAERDAEVARLKGDLDGSRRLLAERDADAERLKAELDAARDEAARVHAPATEGAASPVVDAVPVAPPTGEAAARQVRSLEEALATTRSALAESREREKGLHLMSSLRSERDRTADRHAVARIEALEAENAALQDELRAARAGGPETGSVAAQPGDAELRESIRALGVAVAAMTRDAPHDPRHDPRHGTPESALKDAQPVE